MTTVKPLSAMGKSQSMMTAKEAEILIRHYAKILADHPLPKEGIGCLLDRMTELFKIKETEA